jgi:predicted nucleic acid-binding Zn ribbon protein
MKLDTSRTFGNATYVLTDREVAALLADARLDIGDASPLRTVDRSVFAKTLPPEAGELGEALKVLTNPDKSVAIRTWPNEGGWMQYRTKRSHANFAMHSRNPETGANMIMWPVAPSVLKSMAAALLGQITPVEAAAADFALSFSELLVLASLVDSQQETILRSLADRSGQPKIQLTVETVEAAYAKGLKDNSDPRWMVSRLGLGLDTELPAGLAGLPAALDKLCDTGVLIKEAGGYKPSLSGELIFHQLAGVEGMAAVIVKDEAGSSNAVRRIYQASRWQIWRYAFDDGLEPDARVQLSNISLSSLADELDTLITISAAPPETAEAAAETSACPSCGSEVTPGQKFCPECGTKLGVASPPPQAPQTSPPLKRCPQCNAELEPGLKFCTECGFPVML